MSVVPQVSDSGTGGSSLRWVFQLDTLQLSRFEVPEEFSVGFEANIAVHKYISEDGRPQIKAHKLGVYPIPTRWEGTLYGINALERHQEFERLVNAPGPVRFIYGPLVYLVAVQKYEGKIRHQLEVRYTVELIVLEGATASIAVTPQEADLDAQAQSFFDDASDQATTYLSWSGLPTSVVTAQGLLVAALVAAYPLRSQTIDQIRALALEVSHYTSALDGVLAPLKDQNLDESTGRVFSAILAAKNDFSRLLHYLQVSTGEVADDRLSIEVQAQAGVSLYDLAAQFYPNVDPTLGAQNIARANYMDDFVVAETRMLIIPPYLQ